MSNVSEIKSAIEKLEAKDLDELVIWLQEYKEITNASADVFSMYDREEAR